MTAELVVERVALGPHGAQQVGLAAGVERAAQAADGGVDRPQLDVEVGAPDAVEELDAAEDAAGVSRKWRSSRNSVGERWISRSPRKTRCAARSIRRSWKVSTCSAKAGRDPAQHGAHACDQLGRRERLGHEVVGAGLEAAQPVRLLAARRQHDDRQVRGLGPRGAGGGTARCPESCGSIQSSRRRSGSRSSISVSASSPSIGLRDVEAGRLEVVGSSFCSGGLVLDDQDQRPHGVSPFALVPAGD